MGDVSLTCPEPSTTFDGVGVCKCCGGSGVQTNQQTGIRELCKCCGGSGKMGGNRTITTCESGSG